MRDSLTPKIKERVGTCKAICMDCGHPMSATTIPLLVLNADAHVAYAHPPAGEAR